MVGSGRWIWRLGCVGGGGVVCGGVGRSGGLGYSARSGRWRSRWAVRIGRAGVLARAGFGGHDARREPSWMRYRRTRRSVRKNVRRAPRMAPALAPAASHDDMAAAEGVRGGPSPRRARGRRSLRALGSRGARDEYPGVAGGMDAGPVTSLERGCPVVQRWTGFHVGDGCRAGAASVAQGPAAKGARSTAEPRGRIAGAMQVHPRPAARRRNAAGPRAGRSLRGSNRRRPSNPAPAWMTATGGRTPERPLKRT